MNQLDFVFIDNEHAPLGRESTMALCQLYAARGIVPLVRIPVADPTWACMALDAGAQGVICPYIEDPEVLLQVAGAVKYRPLKGQKLQTFLREGTGVEPNTLEYLDQKNKDNLLIANIESVPAMERLEEILQIDELDAVLVGPNDLSISLNMPDDYENPMFITAVEEIIQKARAAGKGAGIHYSTCLEQELRYIEHGANLVVHSADALEAAKKINGDLARLRAEFGDSLPSPETDARVV